MSCVRLLASEGVRLMVADTRDAPPLLPVLQREYGDVPLFLGDQYAQAFAAAEQIIVSPGVSLKEPNLAAARQKGTPVLGDVELFARHARAPVIAITGSNGKSTVTTVVAEMARSAGRDVRVGGNIGTPVLDLLQSGQPELYVLELSSFQLETTTSLDPAAAVVLNISPDHLDRYSSLDEYRAAKNRIYNGTGVVVVNRDDPALGGIRRPKRPVVRFGLGEPQPGDYGLKDVDGESWFVKGRRLLMPVSELKMRGRHNQANALAALALGEAVGLPFDAMLDTLQTFPGLPHRMQFVGRVGGVDYFNDSKATNVGAVAAALAGFAQPVVLIAGGVAKESDFSLLRQCVAAHCRAVVLIGRDAPVLEKWLNGATEVRRAPDMVSAVRLAAALARQGEAVLLSPACASFDMFESFEERGGAFCAAVRGLAA